MKTAELTGAALDWAVAKCEKVLDAADAMQFANNHGGAEMFNYSSDWAQGGPIMAREIAKIERFSDSLWEATAFTRNAQDFVQNGPTPLIAAMRCFVASKLGDEVEVPDELMEAA